MASHLDKKLAMGGIPARFAMFIKVKLLFVVFVMFFIDFVLV
jgi:hypothetical protein